ncbi:Sensory box histidine kinase [Labilithrix luteola]|uniref:histidine kinase n=1 Tax=Labilithrix luteola TaxID=1391654 RepID=A0A0K1PT22_9BACT|nr:PAS domain-containing sensor histidine kinase [Labilithrix luteola]AKU96667.1 Sensory box histidine kinase [Labilithrix luteola]
MTSSDIDTLRPLLQKMPAAMWAADGDLRVTFAFGRSLADLGMQSIVGKTIDEVFGVRALAGSGVIDHHRIALQGQRQLFRYDFRGRRYDLLVDPVQGVDGEVNGCVGVAMDVTELRDTELRLANEVWLVEARSLARIGSWSWDETNDSFSWSDEMYGIFGVPTEEGAPPASLLAFVHPDDVGYVQASVRRAQRGGAPFTFEYRICRPDGLVRTLHARGQRIHGSMQSSRVVGTCWDVTDLGTASSWPERSAALLRAALEATADGILVVNRRGDVVTYNQRFLELWRIPTDIAERSDNAALIRFVKSQLIEPDSFTSLVRENHADPEGEYYYVLHFLDGRVYERCARPHRVGTEVLGRVLSFRDVTEREHLLAQAQHAVRQRDEFLSIAAHEIRGPITSIRLAVQHLQRIPRTSESVPKVLEIIEREQRRLVSFVDELLDLGRIRAVGLHFEIHTVDLTEVVREVTSRMASDLARAGSTLVLRDDEKVIGQWDRLRLDQVVTNLLSNAIKFGNGKPIEIEVLSSEGRASLSVRDHGIGVAPEMRERIFQPFERGVSVRNYGGLGLGLYIVRTIAETLGGTVNVENHPGGGAIFKVDLPLARGA